MSFELRPVFGTASFGSYGNFGSEEGSQQALDMLKKHGVQNLDTAQYYGMGKSEQTLGNIGATKDFLVDTKWIGGWLGKAYMTEENVKESAQKSLKDLQVKQVDIFYIHCPDNFTPYEETLKAINEVYTSGGFKRFGLSNYSVQETQKVIDICKKEGYVMPSVYQGSYSAAARLHEDELLPLLRKHNIAYYAYSPIAGGFLTKDRKFIEDQQGRFSKGAVGGIYHKMYAVPNMLKLLDTWNEVAEDEGVSKAELAYRWVNHHSVLKKELGDGVIFGASRVEQIDQTCQYLKAGPLSPKAVEKINGLWATVKDEAIMDNFQAMFGGDAKPAKM